MQFRPAAFLACAVFFASQAPYAHAGDDSALTLSAAVAKEAHTESVAPKAEPSVQKPTGDIIPAASAPSLALSSAPTDLWERIRTGFALEELNTPLVQEHEAWYANRPEYVARMVERSQRYLYHIVEEVEKRGMPMEIALLPMIESAFNPKAYSRSHASGIWQFIPSTGKTFGLEQTWWYDGRRDVKAATNAALDYLQKLHDMFGSWELALAAYNWGEGSVSRAIARNEARGEPTDYLSLRMPPETRNYVPKLLAVKHIITDPASFGLALAPIPNRPYFAEVTPRQHMDVALAARLAEMPVDEFLSLNPAYNRPVIRAKGTRTLLLPADKVEVFNANLENYSKPLVSWQSYTVGRGEKLNKVARKFSITVARLKEVNGIVGKRRLAPGQTLLVPAGHANASTVASIDEMKAVETLPEGADAGHASKLTHTVKKGDTLASIARRYSVSAAQLKAWNHLKSNRVAMGQKLAVRSQPTGKRTTVAKNETTAKLHASARNPRKVAADSRRTHHYTVRRGDTVVSIAKRFNVAVNDVQRWNNLSSRRPIYPGTRVTLILPGKG
jgi:membrane-bound lytic murein transglycosylase D